MLFGISRINAQGKIRLDEVDMERVTENTFLDEKLIWKSHIKQIHDKVSRSIAVLQKAKQVPQHKLLCILYCSLVSLYLS